jgi:uncharacterized membrane-anchored protein YitT (DUF2179 family)
MSQPAATKPPAPAARVPHSWLEDAVALVIGTLVVSFGVHLLRQGGALTGGTAGLAFLIHYATGMRFGVAFFLINLPFYVLAMRYMGLGFLALFRHRASLGGTGILALFAQDRYGLRAGHVQMAFDLVILLASFAVVQLLLLLASVAGALVLNTIIAMNHRPERYLA